MITDMPSFIPKEFPRDQPYICTYCKAIFISFRSPYKSEKVYPPITQHMNIHNVFLTCGKFSCWSLSARDHGQYREDFFKAHAINKEAQAKIEIQETDVWADLRG